MHTHKTLKLGLLFTEITFHPRKPINISLAALFDSVTLHQISEELEHLTAISLFDDCKVWIIIINVGFAAMSLFLAIF